MNDLKLFLTCENCGSTHTQLIRIVFPVFYAPNIKIDKLIKCNNVLRCFNCCYEKQITDEEYDKLINIYINQRIKEKDNA